MILDHNVVEIPDDQVIVKAYHSAIPDHPFRYCVPCSLEEFFIMMDGALFSFLDPLDLVAMMGNILDNAIEASEKCAKEKRFIRLRSAQRAGLVLLSAENSCLEQLRVSSLPGTDKADRENHGFGLKNIQDTARRYDGEMHCEAEAGTFTLTLLFPRDDT